VPAVLLAAYVALLAAVLLAYTPALAVDVVSHVEATLQAWGAPEALTAPGRVEFVLNAAMFTPLTFLAALTFPEHPWANWAVYGFLGSCGVELLQGLLLPPRSAQFEDVVANTLGAVVGSVAAALLTHRIEARRRLSHEGGTADPSKTPR
jgi:hypothetical protein